MNINWIWYLGLGYLLGPSRLPSSSENFSIRQTSAISEAAIWAAPMQDVC